MMSEIEAAPASQKTQLAQRLATRAELSNRGIPLPNDLRVTLRWFEDPANPRELERTTIAAATPAAVSGTAADLNPTVCTSIGFFACITYGESF